MAKPWRAALLEQAGNAERDLPPGPGGIDRGKALKEKEGQIARIQDPVVAVLEAGRTGQSMGPKPGRFSHFFAGDEREHPRPKLRVRVGFPQAAGFNQRSRPSRRRRRRRSWHRESSTGRPCPCPRARPGDGWLRSPLARLSWVQCEDAVEGGAVVVGQRKEESVGLAFRGGVLIAVGVEDAALARR